MLIRIPSNIDQQSFILNHISSSNNFISAAKTTANHSHHYCLQYKYHQSHQPHQWDFRINITRQQIHHNFQLPRNPGPASTENHRKLIKRHHPSLQETALFKVPPAPCFIQSVRFECSICRQIFCFLKAAVEKLHRSFVSLQGKDLDPKR